MEHKGEPFGGSQGFEDDEQGETYGVGKQGFLFGVDVVVVVRDFVWRVLGVLFEGLFVLRFARAQHVEAHARDDRCQPSA